jgi:hypothetical protein
MGIRVIPGLIVAAVLAGCAGPERAPILTAEAALDRVAELPEVRRWMKLISELSKGEVGVIVMVDQEPEGPGDRWVIRVAENHDTHIATWKWFTVDRAGAVRPYED